MNLETTTCISHEHLALVKMYSKKYNITLSSFILQLINYIVSYKYSKTQSYTRLSYRPRYSNQWKRFHLSLIEHEYEFLMDIRKVYKISIAKMIAFCIDNFLYEFVSSLDKQDNTDNYRFSGYTFQFYIEEGIPCCKFYWGPHPDILKKATLVT